MLVWIIHNLKKLYIISVNSTCHSRPYKDGPRLLVPQGLQADSKTHGDLQREGFHTRGVRIFQSCAQIQTWSLLPACQYILVSILCINMKKLTDIAHRNIGINHAPIFVFMSAYTLDGNKALCIHRKIDADDLAVHPFLSNKCATFVYFWPQGSS